MTPLLSLLNVSYRYPATNALLLEDVCLDVADNDRIGLFGSNGTGKSTLFHICTGLLAPEQGTIKFQGKYLEKASDFQMARLAMGYLLQRSQDQLFCATVLEDVAFGPLNQGLSPLAAKELAETTLEQMGIMHLADRSGCNLSGGEQKLAALATILAMQPKLLLLDEPTNDLDEKSQQKLELFLSQTPIPFVLVSHDKNILYRNTTKQLLLENGRILPYSTS